MTKVMARIKRENSRVIKESIEEERRILGLPEFPSTRMLKHASSLRTFSAPGANVSPRGLARRSFNI